MLNYAALPEPVNCRLRVQDGQVRIGPSKANFEFWKRNPVDNNRLAISALNFSVPQPFAGLE